MQAPGIHGCPRHTQISLLLFAIRLWERCACGEVALGVAGVAPPRLEAIWQSIAGVEQGRRAGAAGILPFRFGRQTIVFPFLLRQPLAELHRLLPRDGIHRFIIGSGLAKAGITLPILPHRHFGGPHVKGLCDRDTMRGLFIPVSIVELLRMLGHLVIRRRAILPHGEAARPNTHQLHADAVRDRLRIERRGCEKEG